MASSGSSADLVQLANDIAKLFNKEELVLFCDGLGMDYEDLAGDTRSAKIRELTRHYDRRGRLQELVDAINRERPGAKLQISYKSSKPQTENRPLSPANILSGIIVTVVGGLIVFWVTQVITSNATPISMPTVAPAVISSASTLTPQPTPIIEPTATSEPSPIPATPTTAAPTNSPTETPGPTQLPSATITQMPLPTSTNAPAITLPPQNSYCSGTIDSKQGDRLGLGKVFRLPDTTSPAIEPDPPLVAGDSVKVVQEFTDSALTQWYQITRTNDRVIGWLEAIYISLQPPSCVVPPRL